MTMAPNPLPPDLDRRAWRGFWQFVAVLAVLIFLPAWSLRYWQGWLFFLVFAVCMACGTSYFLRHDPVLVSRRLAAGPTAEREPRQRRIQLFAVLALVAVFVLPALDHRFGWSLVPAWCVLLGDLAVVSGFAMVFRVFRENSYASAIVEVNAGQRVISTGPYALVRHPMYAAAMVLLAGIPPALGSWWGLLVLPAFLAVLAARLLDEERHLVRHLPGYDDYRRRARWRLLPGVW